MAIEKTRRKVTGNSKMLKNKSKDSDSNLLVMSYSEDSFLTSYQGPVTVLFNLGFVNLDDI